MRSYRYNPETELLPIDTHMIDPILDAYPPLKRAEAEAAIRRVCARRQTEIAYVADGQEMWWIDDEGRFTIEVFASSRGFIIHHIGLGDPLGRGRGAFLIYGPGNRVTAHRIPNKGDGPSAILRDPAQANTAPAASSPCGGKSSGVATWAVPANTGRNRYDRDNAAATAPTRVGAFAADSGTVASSRLDIPGIGAGGKDVVIAGWLGRIDSLLDNNDGAITMTRVRATLRWLHEWLDRQYFLADLHGAGGVRKSTHEGWVRRCATFLASEDGARHPVTSALLKMGLIRPEHVRSNTGVVASNSPTGRTHRPLDRIVVDIMVPAARQARSGIDTGVDRPNACVKAQHLRCGTAAQDVRIDVALRLWLRSAAPRSLSAGGMVLDVGQDGDNKPVTCSSPECTRQAPVIWRAAKTEKSEAMLLRLLDRNPNRRSVSPSVDMIVIAHWKTRPMTHA